MSTQTSPTVEKQIVVEVKHTPGQDYLGRRFSGTLGTIGQEVASAYGDLYRRISEAASTPAGPPFLIAGPPDGGKIEIEVGAPCEPVPEPTSGQHRGRLEPGKAAVTRYQGAYEGLGAVYSALFQWVDAHGYRRTCNPREVYLNGPADVRSPADLLTELIQPLD